MRSRADERDRPGRGVVRRGSNAACESSRSNTVREHDVDASPAARAALKAPITRDGWAVPGWLSALLVAGIGLSLLGVAMLEFARAE